MACLHGKNQQHRAIGGWYREGDIWAALALSIVLFYPKIHLTSGLFSGMAMLIIALIGGLSCAVWPSTPSTGPLGSTLNRFRLKNSGFCCDLQFFWLIWPCFGPVLDSFEGFWPTWLLTDLLP